MAEERKQSRTGQGEQSVETELDSLNAEIQARRNPSRARRRRIESGIEERAKKRRSQEAPVSSAYKSSG